MNIGYHDNFGCHAAAPCWHGAADWENAQIEMIDRDFQAAMPDIIALAKEQLDDDEFAEFVASPKIIKEWFYELAKIENYTTADSEMLREWFHSN